MLKALLTNGSWVPLAAEVFEDLESEDNGGRWLFIKTADNDGLVNVDHVILIRDFS